MTKAQSLTHGSVKDHLIRLTGPMIFAIIAHMSFTLADTYFVSLIGGLELTAISFSFPVVMVLLNLSIGYGIGCTSVLSRLIGNGQESIAGNIGSISVYCMFVFATLISLLGIFTTEPLFSLLGAEEKHLDAIYQYMLWSYPAMGLRMVAIAISSLFKCNGIMGIPSKAMLITAAINIVLDPVLIFGLGPIPAFGIEGAGMASFIANILAVIYEFYMAGPRGYNFMPKPKRLCEKERAAFKQIFSIGLPSSVANALNPTAISLGNYYVAQTSVLAVAGFGVATKVQAFSMIPILALSSATGPLIGQNFAADKLDRVREILKYALGFSCLWFLIQALALYFFSYPISGVFTDQAEILQPSSMYLEIVGFSLLGYSFIIIANSAMNAVNKPIIGFSLILFRTLAVFIPSYYLYTSLNMASPVIWAYFTANFLSIFYALFSLRYFFSGKNI